MTPSFEQKAPTLIIIIIIIIFGFRKTQQPPSPILFCSQDMNRVNRCLVCLKEVRIKWFLFEIICNFWMFRPPPPHTSTIHAFTPRPHQFHPSSQLLPVVGSSGEEEDRSALNQVTSSGSGATSTVRIGYAGCAGYVCVRLWEYIVFCVGMEIREIQLWDNPMADMRCSPALILLETWAEVVQTKTCPQKYCASP